jgi:hypothetical protein
MNTSLRSTLYVSLLAVGLIGSISLSLPGCKPADPVGPTDPDKPDSQTILPANIQVGFADGMRSTTVTLPDDMSAVAYPTLPQPPVNCRIVKVTQKTLLFNFFNESYGVITGKEKIQIDGKNLTVFVEQTTSYRYDSMGRIIEEVIRPWNTENDTTTYQYYSGYIRYRKSTWRSERIIEKDSLPLNERGLSIVKPDVYRYGFYDANGYLVLGNWNKSDPQLRRVRRQFKGENLQVYTDSIISAGETQIQYTRYLTHPNFPNRTPFYGQESKHLFVEQLRWSKGNPYYTDGLKYQTRYFYQFDSKGRVSRMIAYGRKLSDWPFVQYQGHIGILDYEYSCP